MSPIQLADECKRLANQLGATSLDRSTEAELVAAINRLRDMAPSGAKECAALQRDAERYRLLKEKSRGDVPMVRVLIISRGRYIHHVNPDERLDAIATTKGG